MLNFTPGSVTGEDLYVNVFSESFFFNLNYMRFFLEFGEIDII